MRIFCLITAVALAACAATEQGSIVIDARSSDASRDAPIDAGIPDAPRPDAAVSDATALDGCTAKTETCNGIDDDCDTQVDEDFAIGTSCTAGVGVCERTGTVRCAAGGSAAECSVQPGTGGPELCGNGLDDDCDDMIDDGFTMLGQGCNAGMGQCRRDGQFVCSDDERSLVCNVTAGTPTAELCGNGIDEDCDGTPDDGFENFGLPCSVGTGACTAAGLYACTANRLNLVCNAVPLPPGVELCGNGMDDDCDTATDEGFDVGAACDGIDADHCPEGSKVCSGDGVTTICNDFTASNQEDCDGVDNDCNVDTPDGADEPVIELETQCDSLNDSDLCVEGKYVCQGGGIVCTDPANDDLSNDVANCGGCEMPCETTNTTSVSCTGFTCSPVCAFGWQSCDNNPRNGCETTRLSNADCGSPINLGDGNGDDPEDAINRTGFSEVWYRVRMLEDDVWDQNAVGRITLTNPADARFTVCAYCASCTASRFECATPGQGESATIALGREDKAGTDEHVELLIHVSFFMGDSVKSSCGNWTLKIQGSDDSNDCTCDGRDSC